MTDYDRPTPLSMPPDSVYNIRKKRYHRDANYEASPIALNLFSVYQICELACGSDHLVREHRQICHEISYIVSGEGVFYRNGKAYEVCPNMVFLVNDQDVHTIRSSKDSPLRYMCLGFAFDKDELLQNVRTAQKSPNVGKRDQLAWRSESGGMPVFCWMRSWL